MKLKILSIILVISILSCRENSLEPEYSFPIVSSNNSFDYQIDVIRKNPFPNATIIFVLDSEELLPIVDRELDNLNLSESITLIGIKMEENKRVRDYTPTAIEGEESGNADDFFTFIGDDLIPELESQEILDSSSQKVILGHSIGGLAECYAFTNHHQIFTDYIILSPSLFWDDFNFFEIEANQRQNISQNEAKIFIGIGQNEDFGITNGFEQFTTILEDFYPNTEILEMKVNGNHFGSRDELINEGLNYIIQ